MRPVPRSVLLTTARVVMVCGMFVALGLPTPNARATDDRHAADQVTALLGDRPSLAKSLEARPVVREWIFERFRETQPPLVWDPISPVSGRAAEWDARDPHVTLLRVDGAPSGIDQLAHLVFELHNVQGYATFAAIHEGAVRGEVSRDEYAFRMLEQEFRALITTRAFYHEHLSDLSATEKKEARGYYRLLHGPDSFEEHVSRVRKAGFDLFDHYRELYDDLVLTERMERQRSEEQ